MSEKSIRVRGAREHNLRGLDVDIPRDRLVIVTGLSGSGKSSLAFDTVYAEGQRKYMESLSAYARQFLDQLRKPDVESIEGLPPTIAIEQRSASHNPRSTVATTTEVYDYLRLLFARAGEPRCWHREPGDARGPGRLCGHPIKGQSATQVIDRITQLPEGTRLLVLAPLVRGKKGHHQEVFESMVRQGFVRARADGEVIDLRELRDKSPFRGDTQRYQQHHVEAVVDRVVIHHDQGQAQSTRQRVADSVELALKLGSGMVIASHQSPQGGPWTDTLYSEHYACPIHADHSLSELEPRLFSFNSPQGACPACGGLGKRFEFDPELVVPDPGKSLAEGAIDPWKGGGKRSHLFFQRVLRRFCATFGADIELPFKKLTKTARRILLEGANDKDKAKFGSGFEGVLPNLRRRMQSSESEYLQHWMASYLAETPCDVCGGARLRPESLCVHLSLQPHAPELPVGLRRSELLHPDEPGAAPAPAQDKLYGIHDVTRLTIEQAHAFFEALHLDNERRRIAEPILKEVRSRLRFMLDVGLGYLTLNRATATLSGGEAQRIRLATQVGSGLVGCCYVLDEPTIGLHQRDNDRLISTLRHLTDIGNTVLVVEHDEDTIRAADWVIDIGPGPGVHGGRLIASGTVDDILACPESVTGQFLRGERAIPVPPRRRPLDLAKALIVRGARENNLRRVDVPFPLGGIVCVTGVSGSGKSTLVNQVLLRAVRRRLLLSKEKPGAHDAVLNLELIDRVIEVDQSPIGRTPRSNPVTYTGAFDPLRQLFTKTQEAKVRGYQPGRFSFNVKGGRCEACEGQGTRKVEMHFLPDVYVECEACRGRRYNRETLEITYRGKNIADVLDMTIEQAVSFFDAFPKVLPLLRAMDDVGLGYMALGQRATTMSGGEAQRVKLAAELGKRPTGHTLYVLDEPTTGLHFADIERLLLVLHRLADAGNTVVVIEHNLDVIKAADWIIDLGPEGGDRGGQVVAQGTPESVAQVAGSHTGRYLRRVLGLG